MKRDKSIYGSRNSTHRSNHSDYPANYLNSKFLQTSETDSPTNSASKIKSRMMSELRELSQRKTNKSKSPRASTYHTDKDMDHILQHTMKSSKDKENITPTKTYYNNNYNKSNKKPVRNYLKENKLNVTKTSRVANNKYNRSKSKSRIITKEKLKNVFKETVYKSPIKGEINESMCSLNSWRNTRIDQSINFDFE